MTTEDQLEGIPRIVTSLLRVGAVIIFFPILWLAVGFNFFGIAKRFSFLPGISQNGGVLSGIVALFLTVSILGVLVGGATAATGANIPVIDGGDDIAASTTPTPESTPTPSPTPTVTPTATPTATASQTSTPKPMTDFERFETEYRSHLNETMKRDEWTGVPILATEYRMTENGTKELWVVFWQCSELDSVKDQRISVANNFANAAGYHEGKQPDRLLAYGVTNLQQYDDSTFSISTDAAERVFNGSLLERNYAKHWVDRRDSAKKNESQIAYKMAVEDSGNETAHQAFKEHHREIGGCPGGASEGTGDANN